MAFLVRKLVEALSLPVGLCVLLVIAGLLSRRRWLAFVGVLILWLAATPLIGLKVMALLEDVYPPMTVAQCPDADAVLVLGGGIIRGQSLVGLQWGLASNRFFTGVDLVRAGNAKFLILTNGIGSANDAPAQGDLLKEEAIRRGIQEDRIILIGPVLTTEDEAKKVAALPGIARLILVTSAFHMPRAAMLVSAFGLRVIPFPTDQHILRPVTFRKLDLIPDAAGLQQTELALREYYGLLVYKLILTVHPPAPRAIAPLPAAVSVPR